MVCPIELRLGKWTQPSDSKLIQAGPIMSESPKDIRTETWEELEKELFADA